jgi:hypothetical protein
MDGEPWSPELLDWLSSDLVAHNYDMKHLLATIIGSRAYQLVAVESDGKPAKHYVFRGPEIRRLTAEEFSDAVASITGDWHVAPPSENEAPAEEKKLPMRVARALFRAVSWTGNTHAPASSQMRSSFEAPSPGAYSREWRIAANSLTRALGRPIRDQVFSTRDTQATTIQAVELVNGETLTHWLSRGARKMAGQLPPDPRSLFAAQITRSQTTEEKALVSQPESFDIDVSNSSKLYLIVQDALSTAPDKATPLWADAVLEGPSGKVPLSSLKPIQPDGLRQGAGPVQIDGVRSGGTHDAVRVKLTSLVIYDIAGKGFTRFHAAPGFEPMALAQGEHVTARFFVFDKQPDMDRLVPPLPGTPIAPAPPVTTVKEAIDRVFQYAVGRAPSPAERRIAEATITDPAHPGQISADGLADLLWAVLMKPEFQLIY